MYTYIHMVTMTHQFNISCTIQQQILRLNNKKKRMLDHDIQTDRKEVHAHAPMHTHTHTEGNITPKRVHSYAHMHIYSYICDTEFQLMV